MPAESPYIICPHIRDDTKHLCGLNENGKGQRTKLSIPFQYMDGEEFIIECPTCENDVLVRPRIVQSEEQRAS